MSKKKNIIVLFMNVLTIVSYSQNTDLDLHHKYWYYKARFNNDFIKIGHDADGHGQSIPFGQREFISNFSYNTPSNILKAGDASGQLGLYVAVLATEYRMLKDKGQDVSVVKNELFCALNAINRIDYFAEEIISFSQHPGNPNSTPLSPNLNGFFVRDDIPADFVKNNYRDFNYYNDGIDGAGNPLDTDDSDKGFTQLNNKGQLITYSDYQSFEDLSSAPQNWNDQTQPKKDGHLHNMEMSHDQAYFLLFGLTMAAKLVDAGETNNGLAFHYGSGETELRTEAINISDRIIKHIKNSAGGLWTVRDPANQNKFVQVGHIATPYAFALDNVGCFIKYNQDFPSYSVGSLNVQNPCTDYRNAVSNFPLGPIAWNTLVGADGGPTVDMQGFYHALSSIANCTMESRSYLDVYIQDAINAVLAQIQNIANWLANKLQELNDKISNLPGWAKDLLKDILKAIINVQAWANSILNDLFNLLSSLYQQLTGFIKVNTTQERLINNHYANSVIYEDCGGFALNHIGSKQYFGVFAHRVLHAQNPLPAWMQIVGGNPTAILYPNLRNELKSLLDQAPCEGNYNFFPNRPGPEWGNPNRLDRMDPTYRYNTPCPTGALGEYHGLDYMLLHNLYYLSGTNASFENEDDRQVSSIFPYSNGMFSKTNPKTKGAFEYITSNSTVNANADATFRAGKIITLKPNFTAQAGSDFHAYIDPYQCASGLYDGQLNKMANPSSNNNSNENTDKQSQAKTEEMEQVEKLEFFSKQLDSLIKAPEVKFRTMASKVVVYPNPSDGIFNVAFDLEREDNINLQIIDATGKEIYSQKMVTGNMIFELNLKKYGNGVYLLIAKNTDGDNYTQKIIISNENNK
jgi:hypothetical protein